MNKEFILEKYHSGDYEAVLKECTIHTKKINSLSDEEKNFLVGMFLNLNNLNKALLFINDRFHTKIALNSLTDIKSHVHLANIKARILSEEAAFKIVNETLPFIADLNSQDFQIKGILSALTGIALNYDNYELAQKVLDQWKKPNTINEITIYDCFLNFDLIKVRNDNSNSANINHDFLSVIPEHLKNNKILTEIAYIYTIDSLIQDGSYDTDKLKSYLEILETSSPTHISWLSRIQGIYFAKKSPELSIKYLMAALNHAEMCSETIETLYYLEKFHPNQLTIEQKIFLRCSPQTSKVSKNLGNEFEYFKSKNLSLNCWRINPTKNTIVLENYNDIHLNENYLDLFTGILHLKDHKKILLSDIRTKLLTIIIGCSDFGAHKVLLTDLLFSGQVFYYSSAKLRVKNLIHQINKLGFNIFRKDNRYFYDFNYLDLEIVIPANLEKRDIIEFIKKESKVISRKTLINLFEMRPSTADAHLKNWANANMIQKTEGLKYGNYIIR